MKRTILLIAITCALFISCSKKDEAVSIIKKAEIVTQNSAKANFKIIKSNLAVRGIQFSTEGASSDSTRINCGFQYNDVLFSITIENEVVTSKAFESTYGWKSIDTKDHQLFFVFDDINKSIALVTHGKLSYK